MSFNAAVNGLHVPTRQYLPADPAVDPLARRLLVAEWPAQVLEGLRAIDVAADDAGHAEGVAAVELQALAGVAAVAVVHVGLVGGGWGWWGCLELGFGGLGFWRGLGLVEAEGDGAL
jgi:hypothetical protein